MLILISILWIISNIYRDYGHIKLIQPMWHSADALFRVAMSCYISWLVFGGLKYAVLFLSWYWLLFDLGLNYKRGMRLLYVGHNAWMDKVTNRISHVFTLSPETLQLTLKVFSIITSTLYFIYA